ncbi:MAG: hypothetical protein Ct9H300mP27_04470 [Chloroflexota bacterium]|nr:MAG: hypothetical protein Ct9H300mP27_04470 [Chloroflexota bacterium]
MYDTFMNFFFQNDMPNAPMPPHRIPRYERGVDSCLFLCSVKSIPLAFG